ncbi:MAG: penicillin acylase family protein [Candidatus Promineofilum sp.]|nr:penicillin acylase family protein [Promineifilum sp.]
MNRAARILLLILGILVSLVLILAIVFIFVSRSPFPDTNGVKALALPADCQTPAEGDESLCVALTAQGLKDTVHIFRDDHGIANIYAQNPDDLFFAQGYVHAQDRMWQMEFWRHIALGRVSEIVGEPGLDNDKFIRTSGWNRIAAANTAYYEQELPEGFSALTSYSAGVNAYLLEHKNDMAISQRVLGLVGEPWEIEPWQPIHSIGWGVVMGWDLGGNWDEELTRARLYALIGQEATDELVPGYPYDIRPVIAPTADFMTAALDERGGAAAIDWTRVSTDLIGKPPVTAFGTGPFLGSNNWVVGGEHTASGLPLLANDPHLGIQMPSIWYQIGLHAPGWNVTGFSFAGIPGVIVGHNDHIAWGVTNVGPDVQDLYIEKLNPDNPNQYEYMGEWRDMNLIEEVIKVNGGEDVVLTARETLHGPIISDVLEDQPDVLAMRWTANSGPSRILQSVLDLNQAQNFDEFREALRFWEIPSQNFVYADVDGNIGYQMPSLIPIRKNGQGMIPVPGWTDEYEWEGYIPFEDLPVLLNPESGYIVTANQAVVDEAYPYFIARDWASGDRAQRITDMIVEASAQGLITADDFARIHMDSKSLRAESYVPLLAGLASDDAEVQRALDLLRTWDYQEHRDSVAASIFEIFYMRLANNVLADDVGEENVGDAYSTIYFHRLAADPAARWWDDATTPEVESREDILLRSMNEAVAWLKEHLGDDMDGWQWGALHTATFSSSPLGESGIGPIESIVNRGPFPVDGGSDLVNANSWSWDEPAAVRSHPSMRMIVDLSDFDASRWVIPTGQSGHPYHPHYDDQIELWLNGDYLPMLFSREAIEAAADDHLILKPGQ